MSAGARRPVVTLFATALLIAPAAPAMAMGINLFWNDCGLGPTATTNRDFACDTNDGSHLLVGSFDPPAGLTLVNGMVAIIDLTSESCPMPNWWQFKNAGTCRQTAFSAMAAPLAGQVACGVPWQGPASIGITTYIAGFGGNHRQVRTGVSLSVPPGQEGAPSPGTEYYAFDLAIQNSSTTGSDACAGCSDRVCIVLTEMKLTQPVGTPVGSPIISAPLSSNYVTWQGAPAFCAAADYVPPGCTTPVMNRTWGQMKGLYR